MTILRKVTRSGKTLAFLALLSAVCLGAVVVASHDQPAFCSEEGRGGPDGPGGPSGHRGGPPIEMMQEELGLTDAQVERIEALHEGQREAMESSREEMMELQKQFHDLAFTADADVVDARALAEQIAELEIEGRMERFQQMQELRSILTDEQAEQMRELMQERGGQRGPGGPGGDGSREGHDAGGERGCHRHMDSEE